MEGRAAAYKHIVASRLQVLCSRLPDDFAQSPPDAITLNCGSDLLRHRKSDPRGARIATLAQLKHKPRDLSPHAGAGREKVGTMLQPLHEVGTDSRPRQIRR